MKLSTISLRVILAGMAAGAVIAAGVLATADAQAEPRLGGSVGAGVALFDPIPAPAVVPWTPPADDGVVSD